MKPQQDETAMRPEVRWTLGCLVAAAAVAGLGILVLLVAIALQPPVWVQVLIGVALAGGGAFLAWLVASALGQSRARRERERRHLRGLH
jgi:phosphate/sulfate permease